MATRHKRHAAARTSARKFEGIADLLAKLEVEAEKVVRRLIDRTEQSSREFKKTIGSLVDQVRADGLATVASEKKEDVIRLAEDVIRRAKEIQFLPIGNFNRDELIREAKKNIDEIVTKLSGSEILARARVTAQNTKAQVLSILSIPSQSEVVKLSRKIANLEGRVNKLTRKAA